MANYIDIGVNLTNSRFDKDRELVIADAQSAGISHQIITGTNAKESQEAYELTKQYDSLFSTAGCHPHDAKDFTFKDFKSVENLLTHDKVVAVGECGLDFNRNFSPADVQEKVFIQQLQLACEVQKPLFLHERDATDTMLAILDKFTGKLPKAVIHCFTGSRDALEAYLEQGFYIGITGWVCDERRGQPLADIIHLIPDDRLMIETDAPYLIPRDMRPKPKSSRNLPQYLPHIGQRIAQIRQQTTEHIARITSHNSKQFFNLPQKNEQHKE